MRDARGNDPGTTHAIATASHKVVRMGAWLAGTPQAQTRCSPCAALQAV